MAKSGARFIKGNRPPRVHIEYEVETYNSREKIELPFITGVMADLSGKSEVEKGNIADRAFVDFDVDNFDNNLKKIAPRVAFTVDNALAGDGSKLGVDLTFKAMKDFGPGRIAEMVPALKKLLDARQELSDLMTYMDGKDGAQGLLEKILADPALMKSLTSAPKPGEEPKPAEEPKA